MYMERFQPATFYLIHYIHIYIYNNYYYYYIHTETLQYVRFIYLFFFIVCNKGNNEKGKQ
jgi:hypothetical protein